MAAPYKTKYLSLVRVILSHEVFNKVLVRYFEKLSPLDKQEVVEIMRGCYIHNVDSETTIVRRAQTVMRWVDWILDLV